MELCAVLKAQEECAGSAERNLTETVMDDVQLEEDEVQMDSADTKAEKQSATSETVEEKT